MRDEYTIVYNEDDCIVAIQDDDNYNVYILSPETIYMNHEICETTSTQARNFSIVNIDEAGDYNIAFNWNEYIKWVPLLGAYGHHKEKIAKEAGFKNTTGYIPETISKKAKDIINKYIR